jgi:hypothetical protein
MFSSRNYHLRHEIISLNDSKKKFHKVFRTEIFPKRFQLKVILYLRPNRIEM